MGLETIALVGLAVAAAGGTAATVVQGEQQKSLQKRALRSQESAQKEAKQSAIAQQRDAEQAEAALNRKQPNVADLLAFEQQPGGLTSTLLSGGVPKSKLKLGKPSLLGDA